MPRRSEVEAHHRWAGLLKEWDGPVAGERPTAYVTIAGPTGSRTNALRNPKDAGIAAQTIMLAARSAGLVGCMVGELRRGSLLGFSAWARRAWSRCSSARSATLRDDEVVVVEEAGAQHGVAYGRDFEMNTHHVPKLGVDDLLV